MNIRILIVLILLELSLFSGEYAVVINSNSEISKLSLKQIKDLFKIKRHFIESVKMVPVNMPATSMLRNEFERKVLRITRDKLNRYWIKQHYQGISPPIIQSSGSSMKLFIKNVNGAIGYLPISSVDSDLRILYEF